MPEITETREIRVSNEQQRNWTDSEMTAMHRISNRIIPLVTKHDEKHETEH